MKISDAMDYLQALRVKHGDVDVVFDCPHCGVTTAPDRVVVGPPVAILQAPKAKP